MPSNAPIGFLDSGVGGVSVLNAARKALPNEDFILYGDSANAPYGTKSEEQVIDLVRNAAHILMQQGIKALVIACNTATGIALETMQKELPIPVVGILPAIRPAQKLRKEGDILVMGTPNTVKTAAVKKLMETDLSTGDGVVSIISPFHPTAKAYVGICKALPCRLAEVYLMFVLLALLLIVWRVKICVSRKAQDGRVAITA